MWATEGMTPLAVATVSTPLLGGNKWLVVLVGKLKATPNADVGTVGIPPSMAGCGEAANILAGTSGGCVEGAITEVGTGTGGGRLEVYGVPVVTIGTAAVDGTGTVLAIIGEVLFTFSTSPTLRFFMFPLSFDTASACTHNYV